MTRDTRDDLAAATPGRRRLSADELRQLFRLAAPQAWAAPMLVALGFAASLAETFGITLVVVFLYAAIGHGAAAPTAGWPLDWIFAAVRTHLGNGGDGTIAIAAGIFVLITAKAGLSLTYSIVSSGVRHRLSEVVRNGLHRQFLTLPYTDIRRHDQGDLLDLLATSSWSIARPACRPRAPDQRLFDRGLQRFLLGLSWRLTAIAAVGSIALFLAVHLLTDRARRLGARNKDVNQEPGGPRLLSCRKCGRSVPSPRSGATRVSLSAPRRRPPRQALHWSACTR